jgi:hypothetical protein
MTGSVVAMRRKNNQMVIDVLATRSWGKRFRGNTRLGYGLPKLRHQPRERLCDEISALWSHSSAATARFLELLGELDEDGFVEEGYKSLPHWLAWRCGIAIGTAQDYVRTAQRLRERPGARRDGTRRAFVLEGPRASEVRTARLRTSRESRRTFSDRD